MTVFAWKEDNVENKKKFFEEILSNVKYKDWSFFIGQDESRLYLQAKFRAQCAELRTWEEQRSRKWFLSLRMTKSEFIQTVFKAVMTAEEHETRECFTYRGSPVFGPHFDVDRLVNLCELKAFDVRDNVAESAK